MRSCQFLILLCGFLALKIERVEAQTYDCSCLGIRHCWDWACQWMFNDGIACSSSETTFQTWQNALCACVTNGALINPKCDWVDLSTWCPVLHLGWSYTNCPSSLSSKKTESPPPKNDISAGSPSVNKGAKMLPPQIRK